MPAAEIIKPKITIKVVGVGGGGNNIVRCVREKYDLDMTLIGINSDLRQLNTLHKQGIAVLPVGEKLTSGRGTGGRVEIAEQAARDEEKAIRGMIAGADLVIIAATMGGGFGTGAAPVVAECARELGALTVAVVTRPFSYEGMKRARNADLGITNLQQHVDTIITIPNDRLMKIIDKSTPVTEAFSKVDNVLWQGVKGITDLITNQGVVNLDFADVQTTMANGGAAIMGIGEARGEGASVAAAKAAIESPLLETSIEGATSVIMNFTGSRSLSMFEVNEASEWLNSVIMNASNGRQANIIWGIGVDENLEDSVRVTVVATGFGHTDSDTAAEEDTAVGLTADWISMPGMGSSSMSAPKDPVQPTQPQARPAAAIVPPNINTGSAVNNRRMSVVEPNTGAGVIDIPEWMRKR